MEIFRQITANNIELKEYPFLKELAMEAYLLENEDVLRLDSENFSDVAVLDAEIALKAGRKTSNRDGRIDILAQYGMDYLSIVELKINEINESTLLQLEDYLQERLQIIEKHPDYWSGEAPEPKWVGVLVGTSISPELQRMLQDGYQTEEGIPIAGLVIRRYRGSKNEIYVITDTYFKYNYSIRDFSKFRFNNKAYNKARLVNAVLKEFVENNPAITYAELKTVFPDALQGSSGVFDTFENAQEVYDRTGHKRHYLNPDELIKLSDSTIATSNQWGVGNIERFVEKARNLGDEYEIENI